MAKNNLELDEIKRLERLVVGYFDYVEDVIERENTFTMEEFTTSVNEFLEFRKYQVLKDKGKVSKKQAIEKAEKEYDIFNKTQKIESDFYKTNRKSKKREEMNKLDELIKELCPNGVEYKKLGELGTIYNGLTGKNKNDFTEGNQKYITYINVFNNISIDIETQDKVKIDRNEKQNKVEYGDVIFTASSENIEDVGMTSVLTNLIEEDLYLNSFCFGFRFSTDIMLPSFSKYLFRSENLRKQIRKTANGATRYNISKEKIKEILVPILPLKIQEEIARILDNYTKSVEELKEKLNAELITRKKQYSCREIGRASCRERV